MTNIELKSCPFCGRLPKTYTFDFGKNHGIKCNNPDCKVKVIASGTGLEEVAEAWNRRADDEKP